MQNQDFIQNTTQNIKTFFETVKWDYDFNEEHHVFRCGLKLHNKLQYVKIYLCIHETGLISYLDFPMRTDAVFETMEFITRINYGIMNGNFEMDLNNRQVRYKIFYPVYPGISIIPNEKTITHIFFLCAYVAEKYGNELYAVMLGLKNVESAIQEITAKEREEIERWSD